MVQPTHNNPRSIWYSQRPTTHMFWVHVYTVTYTPHKDKTRRQVKKIERVKRSFVHRGKKFRDSIKQTYLRRQYRRPLLECT